MKAYVFEMNNGDLMIETGLNFINATLQHYPNFKVESVIELDYLGIVSDKDYPEIKESE
jgi:hypothetical protein